MQMLHLPRIFFFFFFFFCAMNFLARSTSQEIPNKWNSKGNLLRKKDLTLETQAHKPPFLPPSLLLQSCTKPTTKSYANKSFASCKLTTLWLLINASISCQHWSVSATKPMKFEWGRLSYHSCRSYLASMLEHSKLLSHRESAPPEWQGLCTAQRRATRGRQGRITEETSFH